MIASLAWQLKRNTINMAIIRAQADKINGVK